jgi:hypothetical protein
MKATLGDKALLWGTIGGFVLSAIGFTSWLSGVSYVANATQKDQQVTREELYKKIDVLTVKVDELNTRTSRIEGKLNTP